MGAANGILANQFKVLLFSDVPPMAGRSREGIKARGTGDGTGLTFTTGERQVQWARWTTQR